MTRASAILGSMKADRVDISRDEHSNQWLIRIQVGEEVIRRHFHEAKDADAEVLRNAALKTVVDEGYTIDSASIVVA